MSNESTDKELVKRVQKGDKGAFDLLVLKYEHKIVNLVMRYVRDPETASGVSVSLSFACSPYWSGSCKSNSMSDGRRLCAAG